MAQADEILNGSNSKAGIKADSEAGTKADTKAGTIAGTKAGTKAGTIAGTKAGANKERVIQIMKTGWVPAKNVCLSTSGYSMYPLLHPGSKVIISTHVNPARIRIGDIVAIAVHRHSGIMAHRVIFILKRKGKPVLFFTKGDSNRSFDKAIGQNQIIGEIVAIQKENRFINISKPLWRIAGFLIAVSSCTFGLFHHLIDRSLFSSDKKRSRIGSWLGRLFFIAQRVFLYTIIFFISAIAIRPARLPETRPGLLQ